MPMNLLEERVFVGVAQRMPQVGYAPVVLAASGGADSAAMVAVLCESGAIDARRAVVAHFDHALRGGEASAADRACVEALCGRYGLELRTGRWRRPQLAEAAAREVRYRFLAGVARDWGARAIVTGHTADDQVETVVMNMLRGSGVYGLAGMAAVGRCPVDPTVALLRPMLATSRAETRRYCRARGLGFHDDASNEDVRYLRNRVRRGVLPAMESAVPSARASLLALAEDARGTIATLDGVVERAALLSGTDGEVHLCRRALRALPSAAVAHAYRIAVARVLGDAREYDRRHYAVMASLASTRTGATFELPRGIVATVDADHIVLSLGRPGPRAVEAGFAAQVPWRGEAGAWEVAIGERCPWDGVGGGSGETISLPEGAIIRGRRAGDRLVTRAGRHRKLKDEYIDRKVPARERDAAPVIAAGQEVLWTALLGPVASGGDGRGDEHVVRWRRRAFVASSA